MRHMPALSALLTVGALLALLNSSMADGTGQSWDQNEKNAVLFTPHISLTTGQTAQSDLNVTLAKWQGAPATQVAMLAGPSKSGQVRGVHLSLTARFALRSTITETEGTKVVPLVLRAPDTVTSVNSDNETNSNCSTSANPGQGGDGQAGCSVGLTSAPTGGAPVSCSTTNAQQYCSTGSAANGGGAETCSVSLGSSTEGR